MTRMSLVLCLSVAGIGFLAGAAVAQVATDTTDTNSNMVTNSPYGGYWGAPQAATAQQAAAMGMADVVRAAGSYNLLTSQANINNQTADSMYLDNVLKGAQTYWAMKGDYEIGKQKYATPGLTTEDSWRYAQENLPKRLKANELDPVTGKIYWPAPLMDPRYQAYRDQLDKMFLERETAHGSIGYDLYAQTQQVADGMMAELQKNIAMYPSGDYVKMKNFLQSLAYEARYTAA